MSLTGQVTDNPFDLKYRQNTELTEVNDTIQQEISTIEQSALSENPFDLIVTPIPKKEPSKQENTGEEIEIDPRSERDLGFLFWVFLSIVLLFSSVYGVAKGQIKQLYNSSINENFLRQLFRQNQGNFSIVYAVLYLFAFVNIGIFGFQCLSFWEISIPQNLLFLLKLVGSVTFALLGKHLLLSVVGSIFPVYKEISLYNFTIMTFWILIGIFLIPVNILIAYAPPLISNCLLLAAVGLILVILSYRAIRGISIGSKYLISHKFHFFIYLCTVEVLPIIVLIKLCKNYTEATLL